VHAGGRGLAVRWLVAAAAAAALIASCAVPNDNSGAGGGPPRSTIPPATRDLPGMAGDEQTAVRATAAFWERTFPKLFGQQYGNPVIKGSYIGSSGPTCAGRPSVAFNAFYCSDGDFLAWDQNLMSAGYKQIGDAWVYLIISHEWGHAIQARLDRGLVSVAAELQADCFAGATLSGAAQQGIISIEPGDNQELANTLKAVADDFPWTNESDHGNAVQRTKAFNAGARGGPLACTKTAG
jgi:predicted metalloprotease